MELWCFLGGNSAGRGRPGRRGCSRKVFPRNTRQHGSPTTRDLDHLTQTFINLPRCRAPGGLVKLLRGRLPDPGGLFAWVPLHTAPLKLCALS